MTGQTVMAPTYLDWGCASQMQERLMRRSCSTVDALDCDARCRQAHGIGGDFYELTPIQGDQSGIAVGDACGKGLPAALTASNVQSSLRTASFFSDSNLPGTIDAVNRQMYESSLPERYATLFYAIFDGDTGTLRYVNAGHPSPVVIRRDGSILFLEAGGAPVGMFPSWTYEEGVVELHSGDVIIAYTDGVVEATNSEGEEWGLDGLLNVLRKCDTRAAEGIVDRIFAALDKYSQGVQMDDATVLIVRVR
jgi:sigma-B regulation protein RsbU (phosphoserine phosphatase)